jgi:hypothetical protein
MKKVIGIGVTAALLISAFSCGGQEQSNTQRYKMLAYDLMDVEVNEAGNREHIVEDSDWIGCDAGYVEHNDKSIRLVFNCEITELMTEAFILNVENPYQMQDAYSEDLGCEYTMMGAMATVEYGTALTHKAFVMWIFWKPCPGHQNVADVVLVDFIGTNKALRVAFTDESRGG